MYVDYGSSSDEETKETPQQVKPKIQPKPSETKPKTVQIPRTQKKTSKLPDISQLLDSIPTRHFNPDLPLITEDTTRRPAEEETFHNVPPPNFSLKEEMELKESVQRKYKRNLPTSFQRDDECPVMDKFQRLETKPSGGNDTKMQEEKVEKKQMLVPTNVKTKRANIVVE